MPDLSGLFGQRRDQIGIGMTKRIDAELVGIALYDPATMAEAKAVVEQAA